MRRLLAAGLLATLPFAASAADWHLGAGFVSELDNRTPRFGGERVDTEHGYRLLGGLRFGNGFGLEGSWVELGHARVAGIADAGYDVDGRLWSIGLSWAPDTGDLQPYASVGWFDRSEDGTALTIAGPRPVEFDDNGLMAEIGGRWFLSPSFALRAGYTWYDFEADADGSLGLAAEWHFR